MIFKLIYLGLTRGIKKIERRVQIKRKNGKRKGRSINDGKSECTRVGKIKITEFNGLRDGIPNKNGIM